LYESYIRSRVPAEAITIATLTYTSDMKYSALLTSAKSKNDIQGSVALLHSTRCTKRCSLVGEEIVCMHLLIGGNLLSSCLTLFGQVSASPWKLLCTDSSFLQSA